MKKIGILAVGISMLVLLGSCSKYKEGPMFSILPKTERIEGKWKAEKVLFNDIDSSVNYKSHIWEFTRNGSVILQIGVSNKTTGIWTTVSNDKNFVIDLDNGTRETYEIRRLKKNEFWIRNMQSQLDFFLIPQ